MTLAHTRTLLSIEKMSYSQSYSSQNVKFSNDFLLHYNSTDVTTSKADSTLKENETQVQSLPDDQNELPFLEASPATSSQPEPVSSELEATPEVIPCTEESSAADQSVPDEDHDTLDSSPPDVDSTTASQDTVEESTEMDGDQGEEPIEENSETEQV